MYSMRFSMASWVSVCLLAMACSAADVNSAAEPVESTKQELSFGLPTGYHSFQNAEGRCLLLEGGSVVLGECHPDSNPVVPLDKLLWVENIGIDTIRLRAGSNGPCLEVAGGRFVNGTSIQLAECNWSTAQTFRFGLPDQPYYPLTVNGYCVGSDWSPNKQAHIWECNGLKSHSFRAKPIISIPYHLWGFPDGIYEFRAPGTEHCMDVKRISSETGTPLQMWHCLGNTAQRFRLSNVGGGLVELKILGKCITHVPQFPGGPPTLQPCNGSWTQRFEAFRPEGFPTQDRLKLRGLTGGTGMCVTRPWNRSTPDTNLRLATCNGSAAELWDPNEIRNEPVCSGACCNAVDAAQLTQGSVVVPGASFRVTACPRGLFGVYRNRNGEGWQNLTPFWDPSKAWNCEATAAEFVDPAVRPGEHVCYRVLSADCSKWRDYRWSNEVCFTATRDLSKPAQPEVTVVGETVTGITLSIKDLSNNEDGFRIYRRGPHETEFTLRDTISQPNPPNTSTGSSHLWSDTQVEAFQPYVYAIEAFHVSDQSERVSVTAFAASAPLPVENLTVTNVTDSSISITWTAAEPNATHYVVERTPGTGPVVAFSTTHTAQNLEPSTQYCFDVSTAVNERTSVPSTVCATTWKP